MSFYRYGDPCARPLPDSELATVRPFVTDALARYRKSPQVALALQLTEELMNFEPVYGFGYEHEMVAAMNHLRDNGAGPWDILRRIVEVYAVIERATPHRFPTSRVIHHALARSTLRLVSLGRWRSKRRLLDYLGGQIAERLGMFSIAFLRHVEKKHNERVALIRKAADFNEERT